jgi:hypothetical protein
MQYDLGFLDRETGRVTGTKIESLVVRVGL